MKTNFGYRLGILVRRFKDWEHPGMLKSLYIAFCIFIIYKLHLVLYIALGSVLVLIFIILLADLMHNNSSAVQRQKIIKEIQNLQKAQNEYNDEIIGSKNGTGNGC